MEQEIGTCVQINEKKRKNISLSGRTSYVKLNIYYVNNKNIS